MYVQLLTHSGPSDAAATRTCSIVPAVLLDLWIVPDILFFCLFSLTQLETWRTAVPVNNSRRAHCACRCPLVLNAFMTPPPSHPFNFLLIVLLGRRPPLLPRCHDENSFLWATCRLLHPTGHAHEAEQEIHDLCFLSAEIEVTCMVHVWHACTWSRSLHACGTKKKKQKCIFFSFFGCWGQTKMKREVSCWVRANFAQYFLIFS